MRLAVLALVLGFPALALAEPCEDHVDDPVALPWREAGLDAGRGACRRSDVTIDLIGRALIDEPEFYGTIVGGGAIAARFAEGRFEYGFGLRVFEAIFVQNAVLKVTDFGYGPVTAQAAYGDETALGGRPLVVAAIARLEVPFTRSNLDGSSGGLQLGGVATWQLRERLRLHGRVAALGWYGTSTAGTSTRAALLVSADVSWRPIAWLTPTAGVDLQGGWYGAGLDHLAVRAGAHWRITGVWRGALAAGLPVAGTERSDLAFTLGLRRDLD